MSTRPSKIPSVDAFNIILAYDTPKNAVLWALGYLIIMLSTPFWLAPLLGISILQALFFLVLYFILNVVVLYFVKMRADLLQAREFAKRIANVAGRDYDR